MFYNDFRSTFKENTDSFAKLDRCASALAPRVEGNRLQYLVILLSDDVVSRDPDLLEVADQALLRAVAAGLIVSSKVSFNAGAAVEQDALGQKLLRLELSEVAGPARDDLLVNVDGLDCHLVLCESAGLVGADLVGPAHSLARVESPYEIVLLLHLHDRVSQGDGHCKG